MHTPEYPQVAWTAAGQACHARWRSEAGLPPPQDIVTVDDTLAVAEALRLIRAGKALLWQGDWPNARHFLQALTRRVDRQLAGSPGKTPRSAGEAFTRHRQLQGERAGLLAALLVPLSADGSLPLRRAQDVGAACREVFGDDIGDSILALRELLAVVSAHEWRKKGVAVPVLGGSIQPHYGVFSPLRGEYLDLLAQAPLPDDRARAFDIGTGSGVIAALLARRGIARVIATDCDRRALACAAENIDQLGLTAQVEVVEADLFPPGQAPLIVCNPPWLPAQPSSPVEYAVYDPDSRMLRGFLAGLAAHLTPGGEGWLIISDIAEHLGLRSRDTLLGWIAAGGLRVADRLDIRPRHPKSRDQSDPLHAARAAEVTSLWRLRHA